MKYRVSDEQPQPRKTRKPQPPRLENNYAQFELPKLESRLPDDADYTQCQKQRALALLVERVVGEHLQRRRDLTSPDIEAADEIATYLGWCTTCTLRDTCFTDCLGNRYFTGIAGGKFLLKGKHVDPKGTDR